MQFRNAAARLTAAALVMVTLITPAFAVSGTVNTAGDVLNVRAEGNTGSKILTKLKDGQEVEVIGVTEDDWFQIKVNGVEGFVCGDYMTVENLTGLPEVVDPFYVQVTASSLNVRAGMGTDTAKVGSLPKGSVVKVYDEEEGWYHVDDGYISAEYATKLSDAQAAAAISAASQPAVVSASSKGQEVANFAKKFVGYRYVYGGSSPKGFDCSGFTMYVYRQFGISLPHSASSQLGCGKAVSRSQLQPGDLVMFRKGSSKPASHVGVYIGNGKFVHASTPSKGVRIDSLSSSYYATGLVGCRRLLG